MPSTDAFALKNSGLNNFLFAEVGTETNGSTLTILSVLARLGKDPWDEAARWVRLPKALVVDAIAASISQMPLDAQALLDARLTASRLTLLLPVPADTAANVQGFTKSLVTPGWLSLAFLLGALALGVAVNGAWLQPPAAATAGAPAAPIHNVPTALGG